MNPLLIFGSCFFLKFSLVASGVFFVIFVHPVLTVNQWTCDFSSKVKTPKSSVSKVYKCPNKRYKSENQICNQLIQSSGGATTGCSPGEAEIWVTEPWTFGWFSFIDRIVSVDVVSVYAWFWFGWRKIFKALYIKSLLGIWNTFLLKTYIEDRKTGEDSIGEGLLNRGCLSSTQDSNLPNLVRDLVFF